jgi:membrane associated rhomboid family serine protease
LIPIRDTIPSMGKPLITKYIIAANVIIFLLQFIIPGNQLSGLVYYFGFVPREFNEMIRSQPLLIISYYPLLSGIFLHGGDSASYRQYVGFMDIW